MKPQLFFPLMLCLMTHTAFAQENSVIQQLPTQSLHAEGSHLTTRIQWIKFPQVEYSENDLNGQDRHALVRVEANEDGKVTHASIQESTGLKKLDARLTQAVLAAKTKPFVKEGNTHSIIGYQVFSLKLSNDNSDQCSYEFESEVWLKQQDQKKTAFTYRQQPDLQVTLSDLNGHDRKIKFNFKANKHGDVKTAKIKKGSGNYVLDQQVLQAVLNAKVNVPRKYWVYKKSRLTDEIRFDLKACQ